MLQTDGAADVSNKVLDGKLDLMLVGQDEQKATLANIETEQARQDERIKTNRDNIDRNEGDIRTQRSSSNRLDVIVVAVGAAITGVTSFLGGK